MNSSGALVGTRRQKLLARDPARVEPLGPQGYKLAMSAPLQPDRAAARAAVVSLLSALGLSPTVDHELLRTPELVATMYADELLDGYRLDPAEILRETEIASSADLVVLAGVRYVSVCPHHLLPCSGWATVGYLPGGRIVGLGALVRLVHALAHRLVLQESLGAQIATALVQHLGARAAGVHLRARHQCLAMRGERRANAALTTVAWAGQWTESERTVFVNAVPTRMRTRRSNA